MRTNKYDQPVLAAINAANDMVGQEVEAVFFRDQWRAYGGGEANMFDALDLLIANHPDSIKYVYKVQPYEYIKVFIRVDQPIQLKSK